MTHPLGMGARRIMTSTRAGSHITFSVNCWNIHPQLGEEKIASLSIRTCLINGQWSLMGIKRSFVPDRHILPFFVRALHWHNYPWKWVIPGLMVNIVWGPNGPQNAALGLSSIAH